MNFLKIISFSILACICMNMSGQGYLHVNGTSIEDGNNNNFILRGIGTGNWMIQEGYMMLSSDIAGSHHEFRNKLIQTIGLAQTDEFYNSWLEKHFTKQDVDSMAAWGFNSVRLAMHYKWYTLPIEEEPIQGENTWLDKGFELTDSLLSWCEDNQMYLILDMHGAPGGQGYNSSISDYDPTKPSLWESDYNKQKTVALWSKLADRYSEREWIGGYDLLNEVNWTFPGGNNLPLRELYIEITDSIRELDPNHIIFIEGNGYANDFSDMTPPWDNNMVYSFHKYWTYNDEHALDWVMQIRDNYNRPLWLGEAGENSNTWFTNLVSLSEQNNIGWSWWPVKKVGINNILKASVNDDYLQLLEYWRGNGGITSQEAYQAVMTFADNHRFPNCFIQYDVIDALIRQPHTTETKAFKFHTTEEEIFAAEYDLGRNNYAYFDTDTANYHLNTNEFEPWNKSWQYRNDGVDIRTCEDNDTTNGYCVEWIEDEEWLLYTIESNESAAYQVEIRTSGANQGAFVYLEVDGKIASNRTYIPITGSWTSWRTDEISDVIIHEGTTKLKVFFDKGGINFNYIKLSDPINISEIPFKVLYASTHKTKNIIYLNLNFEITTPNEDIVINDFNISINNEIASIESINISPENDQLLVISLDEDFYFDDDLKLSYNGSSVVSGIKELSNISDFQVINKTFEHQNISGHIEAEDFIFNNGFVLEECEDQNGGFNVAYADVDDYLDYLLKVSDAGNYKIDFRIASEYDNAEIYFMHDATGTMTTYNVFDFAGTGGWQNWDTQTFYEDLPKGKYILRIKVRNGEFNLNWMEFLRIVNVEHHTEENNFTIYPNPANDTIFLNFFSQTKKSVKITDINGKVYLKFITNEDNLNIDVGFLSTGFYLMTVSDNRTVKTEKFQIAR